MTVDIQHVLGTIQANVPAAAKGVAAAFFTAAEKRRAAHAETGGNKMDVRLGGS